MENERQKIDLRESVKSAAAGYAVVVLGTACFILFLAILSTIVRIIVGASAGA